MGKDEALHSETTEQTQPAETPNRVIDARFTRATGLIGWFQAFSRRQPLYGPGWIEPAGHGLRLYGSRRTWLGIGERTEIVIPYGKMRNVDVEGSFVRFDIAGILSRSCSFVLESPATAKALADQLPRMRTELFDRHWEELREFNRNAARMAPRPWGTLLLICLCFAMFALQATTGGRLAMFDLAQSISLGALSFQQVQSGEIWRLISSAFLHVDPVHLLVNMWVLWNIGRMTEKLLGSTFLLFIYLSCAALSSLGSLLWSPLMVTVGASGAIYGLFGVFLAYLLVRRTVIPAVLLRAHWLSTLVFVLFSLASGFVQGGVANAEHVAGLLSGLVLGSIIALPRLAKDNAPSWCRPAAAVLLCALLLGAGWQLCANLWAPASDWARFKRSLDWLVAGEAESFKKWGALEQEVSVGKLGGEEAATAYRSEIAPFWRDAEKRLDQQADGSTGEYRQLWHVIGDYAHSRAELAEASANYMEKPLDSNRSADSRKAWIGMNHASAYMTARMSRDEFVYRPRGLSDYPAARHFTQLLPGTGTCARRTEDLRFDGDFGAKTDSPALWRAAKCQAQRDFLSADFAALEARLVHYSDTVADLPDGGASMNGIMDGLSDLFSARPTDLALHMALMADWRRQFSDSVWPALVEIDILSNAGWTIRGHGFAKDVSPQAMQAFTVYMSEADEILREIMTRAAGNRYWYELAVGVKNDLSESRDEMKEVYNEGSTLFPRDQNLHREMLRALMPRWGGSVEEVDALVSKAYARTAKQDGIQVYAKLYWIYADLEGESVDIFSESGADWDLMRSGFRDMVQKHPDSDYLLNGYARFACVAKDAIEYRHIRPQLDGHNSPTAWPPGLSLAICDKRIDDLVQQTLQP